MKLARRLFALTLMLQLFFYAASVHAQETTATINGQVVDSSGAVISAADVTVTNVKTHEMRMTKSGDDGYYTLTFLTPGVYDLSIKAQGFKEYLNRNVE